MGKALWFMPTGTSTRDSGIMTKRMALGAINMPTEQLTKEIGKTTNSMARA